MADCDVKQCPLDLEKWGRFEEKLDNMNHTLERVEAAVQKQNGRVRKLEQWRAYIIGIGAAITFIIASAMKWFVK